MERLWIIAWPVTGAELLVFSFPVGLLQADKIDKTIIQVKKTVLRIENLLSFRYSKVDAI
ncbi:hypothetical protein MASR2M78_21360 [Treponema sp.]